MLFLLLLPFLPQLAAFALSWLDGCARRTQSLSNRSRAAPTPSQSVPTALLPAFASSIFSASSPISRGETMHSCALGDQTLY
jgi:hypothetical protein